MRTDLEILPAKSGAPTCRAGGRFLHSSLDPEREAEKILRQHAEKKAALILGGGLGYLTRAWLHAHPEAPVLVVDWDDRFPELVETHFPGTAARPALRMCVNPDRAAVRTFLDTLTLEELTALAVIEAPGFRAVWPDALTRCRETVITALRESMGDRFTEWEFERIWARNILGNIPALGRALSFARLENTAAGRTAVLAGAGPSLPDSLSFLRQAAGRADLFATDTALPALHEAGIRPEYVVSLDGQVHNLRDFNGLDTSGSVLLTEPTVYPAIPARPFGAVVFFEAAEVREEEGRRTVHSHPLVLWVKQCLGEPGPVPTGGNVLTAALSLAVRLGYTTILFAGMDNAFPGYRYHCRGAYSHEMINNRASRIAPVAKLARDQVRRRRLLAAPANNGRPVATDPVLARYAAWTADAVAGLPELRFGTLDTGGLAIPGIPLLDTTAALALLPTAQPPLPLPQAVPAAGGRERLRERLQLLVRGIGACLDAPDLAPAVSALLQDFPFLGRVFSRQLLFVERRATDGRQAAEFLFRDVARQLERLGRYAAAALCGLQA